MTLDPYRLPRLVIPTRYQLSLLPDLAGATFSGSVSIDVQVSEPVDEIVLNAIELGIAMVRVNETAAPFHLDHDTERLHIDAALQPGLAHIYIEFTGMLNDKLRGFYRSTYTDQSGQQKFIACSQMQATDCRRAFPCFDEPDFKAIFAITLIVDAGLTAISNSPESGRSKVSDGRVAITFEDTMRMSSYLVALIVGDLEVTDPIDVTGTPLRIVHVPGNGHLTALGLDVGSASLRWFQDYYGIAYPGKKLDMIALPDFAAGAMENLGCVTYRETLLLIDPATSTQAEQQEVADVVSHELAHMWFGDLVTMRWWNGIWLNEAFATFMEVMAVEAFRPDWKRWTSFGLERTAAFEVDSLASTRTVEFAVFAPSDCDGMFDVLTYQKGASLLRMLQQFLGEERFRRGVNNYLNQHSYANTETSDLWDSIEAVTSADGGNEPVRELMDSWIWQPGFPLISASLSGSTLTLRQQRFSFDPEAVDATVYIVPINVRVDGVSRTVLLDTDETTLDIGTTTATVLVNANGSGFFRVAYDDALRSRLNAQALAQLSTLERYSLVDDANAAFVAGRLSAQALLALLESFADEQDLAVWQAVGIGLRRLDRIVEDSAADSFRAHVRAVVAPQLGRLGWAATEDEDDLRTKLRALLITLSAVLGNDTDAQQRCRTLLVGADANSDPELVAAATVVTATFGDERDYNRLLDGYYNAPTPQEQLRNLYALAEFSSAELIQRTCEFALSAEVRAQNAPYVLGRCIANRNHGLLAWKIVRQNWDYANSTFPNSSIVRMVDGLKLLNTDEAVADVGAFFSEHEVPQATNTLTQILERQRVNAAVRNREAALFSATLWPGRAGG